MQLPSGRYVSVNIPIYLDSNFTWGEATKNCTRPIEDLVIDGRLIVLASDIERKIIQTAKSLDALRQLLGDRPILVNSWYRPPSVNRRVNGSKFSRHQYGDAVDIRSYYMSPQDIFTEINSIHIDGGLSAYYNFVHIDWRGYQARW